VFAHARDVMLYSTVKKHPALTPSYKEYRFLGGGTWNWL